MALEIKKNDRKANLLIWTFSIVVFVAVTVLERVTLDVDPGFDAHLLSAANAVINSVVAVLLVVGLVAARQGRFTSHKYIMLTAIVLSAIFLLLYIASHLLTGSTWYGDLDKSGRDLDEAEIAAAGSMRYVYYFILGTHILLAGVSLPFILFTAYRALINENDRHRKLAKITWPMWFYVAVTGPVVYLMISKYH